MPQPIPEPRVASRPIPRPRIVAATVDAPQPRVASARPSFNCSVARARVERMVCADARLAAADRAMASVYYRSVATSDAQTRARLQESRGRFLAYRNRCSDDRCIEQAYADRVDEIRDLTEEQ